VVIFAGEARGFPVTTDMGVLQMFLSRADPRTENPGGTSIAKAIDKAIDLLVAVRRGDAGERAEQAEGQDELDEALLQEADQIIVLLTDGEDTTGRPLELAERAAELGIRIYSVGIGSESGEPIMRFDDDGQPIGYATDEDGKPVMTRLDDETLKALAKATKGEYVHVDPNSFGLDEIRERVADLNEAQREASIEIHREEGFAFFIVPAVVLLSIALGLGDRRRPPPQRRTAHLHDQPTRREVA
jgi:Ca-activated chloride channel family protein